MDLREQPDLCGHVLLRSQEGGRMEEEGARNPASTLLPSQYHGGEDRTLCDLFVQGEGGHVLKIHTNMATEWLAQVPWAICDACLRDKL